MSRSYNETSIPNARGRFGTKRQKRISSKKIRRITITEELCSKVDKIKRGSRSEIDK